MFFDKLNVFSRMYRLSMLLLCKNNHNFSSKIADGVYIFAGDHHAKYYDKHELVYKVKSSRVFNIESYTEIPPPPVSIYFCFFLLFHCIIVQSIEK